MSKGLLDLICEVKRGSVEAFLLLISRIESLMSNVIRQTGRVWFSPDLVLVRSCTYMLLDKREGKAYVLVPVRDTYTVLCIDIKQDGERSEQEIIDSICIYVDEIARTEAL